LGAHKPGLENKMIISGCQNDRGGAVSWQNGIAPLLPFFDHFISKWLGEVWLRLGWAGL